MTSHTHAELKLITIPISHYCEKARWALDFAKLPFHEEGYSPVFHYAATWQFKHGRSVPVLVANGQAVGDSAAILRFANERCDGAKRLYPESPEQRSKVDELEALFNKRLGPATRRLIYFYLLPTRREAVAMLTTGATLVPRLLFTICFPAIRALMQKGMRINAESAGRSLKLIHDIFQQVERELAGRQYLVGEAFSAADLTFAALAAPVLLPQEYHTALPTFADLPSDLAKEIELLRASAAGCFALRMFRDHR